LLRPLSDALLLLPLPSLPAGAAAAQSAQLLPQHLRSLVLEPYPCPLLLLLLLLQLLLLP
jgi:hypothetical protein